MDAPRCRSCQKRHWGLCVTEPVTKPTQAVTKPLRSVTIPEPVLRKPGRPKLHPNQAARQRAYRQRQKEKA